ncbi:glycosyltransferase family 2 protein [[Mycoplasma] mobile]|uniref:Putative glycosyltransferase n=1 Tax=Mycoplasma mobile (strain ATCC 43663 / 163K / NCTC 11711) TaxID=267748 RepID=Q6KHN5_MYCM1|nr:glycosyltransferase family 2 protein [[Mycoplasma] mobile]AAT27895.1 putative glycosyltransferase [Mycoplasma mobile 163K]
MEKKLSVIIPCYNCEKFIEKAINSIFEENKKNIDNMEVLIVNDGSKDNSETILNELKDKYLNLKIYKKENGNWGSVINFVKNNKLTTGKYLSILDADDWYIKGALEKIWPIFEKNYDLIISEFSKLKKGKQTRNNVGFFRKTGRISKYSALTPWSMPLGKFVRNEVFYKTVELREKVSFQDMILYNEIVFLSEKIFFWNKSVGVWNLENEGSSTNSPWDKQKIQVFIDNFNYIIGKYKNKAHNGYCLYYYVNLKKYLKMYDFSIDLKWKDVNLYWLMPIIKSFFKFFLFIYLRKHFKNKNNNKRS